MIFSKFTRLLFAIFLAWISCSPLTCRNVILRLFQVLVFRVRLKPQPEFISSNFGKIFFFWKTSKEIQSRVSFIHCSSNVNSLLTLKRKILTHNFTIILTNFDIIAIDLFVVFANRNFFIQHSFSIDFCIKEKNQETFRNTCYSCKMTQTSGA